jgi:hypothetical protein
LFKLLSDKKNALTTERVRESTLFVLKI